MSDDRHVHSLHGYFMRPGDPEVPIVYEVDRIRDGRSFNTRRVVAIQHGRAIFSLSASVQVEEPGLDHQIDMPDVPMPESLIGEADLREKFLKNAPENVRRYWERERPIEMRPISLEHYISREKLARCRTSGCAPTAPCRTIAASRRWCLPIFPT